MSRITAIHTYDFRFPTSQTLSGSDAMNKDPDYSSAYAEISTDADDGIRGVGFVFTLGRGNDVVCKAIESMSQVLIGRNVEELLDNMRLAWDLFVHDSQLRWLGYSDETMVKIAKEETEVKGFTQIKLKVGQNVEDDLRRLGLARETIGPDVRLAVDANQVWDVPDAITWINRFHDFNLAWVEEPTSPDDVIGNATIARAVNPIPIATGEQMQNRIMYKQYLQANAFGIMQIDATRVAGPQEIILEYLLAKKFNKPVCPHAGGVGLCEAVCHFAMFDYIAVSGTMDGRMIEYVDNQHEYFVHPTQIRNGNYVAPTAPGNGTDMTIESARQYLHHA